jgi:type VI secretion system protein VasG
MKNVALRTLDLGLLQAGAGVKGEFENRLKSVIDEVKASPTPIILFIDEAHTLIGAGGAAGQGDAANLLKPALARGDLRTIAATTWGEYKKYFERDPALARRFQVVKVEEPDEAPAIAMMRGLVGMLEQHHAVRVLDEAVVEAVRLSKRYIPGRQLPDKSVSVLDTACARVAMSQSAVPAAVEDCRRRIQLISTEMEILGRETASGADHAATLEQLAADKKSAEDELRHLDARWTEENRLVGILRELRDRLEAAHMGKDGGEKLSAADSMALRDEFERTKQKLVAVQGEEPLVHVSVDAQAVAEVIANWTGIPVGRMVSNEIKTVLSLKETMSERIILRTGEALRGAPAVVLQDLLVGVQDRVVIAVTFLALGPVVLARNRLMTQGTTNRGLDLIAATVLIGNFGLSNEWTLGLLVMIVLLLLKQAGGVPAVAQPSQ